MSRADETRSAADGIVYLKPGRPQPSTNQANQPQEAQENEH